MKYIVFESSLLQTVHHVTVGAMVRSLTKRELSLPSSNLVPIVGMRGPGQVNHALEIPQLVISCYQPASCIASCIFIAEQWPHLHLYSRICVNTWNDIIISAIPCNLACSALFKPKLTNLYCVYG